MKLYHYGILIFLIGFFLSFVVQAKGSSIVIEMDGKPLSPKESLDLVYARTSYDVIGNIPELKINGQSVDVIVLDHEKINSIQYDRGPILEPDPKKRKALEEERGPRLQTIYLLCSDHPIPISTGIHLKNHIKLPSGTSAVLKLDDQPLRKSGNLIKLFACPVTEKSWSVQISSKKPTGAKPSEEPAKSAR